MRSMHRVAVAALFVASIAVPAAAQQTTVTQTDIQRLQDNVYLADRDVTQLRSRDTTRASQLQTELDDLRAASPLDSVLAVVDLRDLADLDVGAVTTADVDRLAESVSPDDLADILFTSGTTGRSKGAMSAQKDKRWRRL